MRNKRLLYNTISSLVSQAVTIVCGFILPRLILETYGSDVNGLVNSISQFLGIIAFFELGVGATIQSALYKPLADKDDLEISKVVSSGNKFFRFLAIMLLGYIVVLIFLYPIISKTNFEFWDSTLLIIAISISLFAQYYFGNVNRLLLTADQHAYVYGTITCVTLIVNTILSVFLMKLGAEIYLVKFVASLVYLFRPLLLYLYVKKNYNINKKVTYDTDPIAQKKNGVAQHLAVYAIDGTSSIILTMFSSLSDVSIYSVYYLVVSGVKTLVTSVIAGGVQSVFGELWAKKCKDELQQTFNIIEWIFHTITIILFGCTAVLIVPFVVVYTKGINDAVYIQPLFGVLLTLGYMLYVMRLPYHSMILAANHYKQTQHIFVYTAVISIGVSIVAVYIWGLIGIAIGIIIAMIYQTICIVVYVVRKLLCCSMKKIMKQFIVDGFVYVIAFGITYKENDLPNNYFDWILCAIGTAVVWGVVSLVINLFAYRKEILQILGRLICKEKDTSLSGKRENGEN